MSFAKSDGAYIQITFDQPITSDASGNQSYFTITVPEYSYMPGGTLSNIIKTVKSTYNHPGTAAEISLAGGTLTDAVVANGVLSLGVN